MYVARYPFGCLPGDIPSYLNISLGLPVAFILIKKRLSHLKAVSMAKKHHLD
jgi:hypothetical protein